MAKKRRNPINDQTRALQLYLTSIKLGETISIIEDLAIESYKVVDIENDACDTILIAGADVLEALRKVAVRLDRSVTLSI